MQDKLREWIEVFLKSRNVFERDIQSFETINGDFILHKTSGDTLFLIRPELVSVDELKEKSGNVSLVVLNTKANVDMVVRHWSVLKIQKDLRIYFVNPLANEKWILKPYVHDQITEPQTLAKGLQSLFETVPSV